MPRALSLVLLAALLAPVAAAACFEDYDPPPDVSMDQPSEGFWTAETPVTLAFTEPIVPESFVVTVYPTSVLDREREIPPGAEAIVAGCTLADAPCGTFDMTLNEARTRVTISVGETFEGREGTPFLIVVHDGLRDDAGRSTRVPRRFDFQVNPACGNTSVEVPLETGVFTMTASLEPVLPIWLHLYLDMAIDPSNGQFLVVATFSRIVDDDRELSSSYDHPDGFAIALDEGGWAVTMQGCVIDRDGGEYFFVSDPFDVEIVALGSIPVVLENFKVQGTLRIGAADDGRTEAEGTMSTSGGSYTFPGGEPNQVEALTKGWTGFAVLDDELPDELPRACDASPCDALEAAGGDCQLAEPWRPNDVVPDATVCDE